MATAHRFSEELDFRRLLPAEPQPDPGTPLVQFQCTNGRRFWAIPPEGCTGSDRPGVRRSYQVSDPDGASWRCRVEISAGLRRPLEELTGGALPPEDPVWDALCRGALQNYLHFRSAPLENLRICCLTRQQVRAICEAAGRAGGRAWGALAANLCADRDANYYLDPILTPEA